MIQTRSKKSSTLIDASGSEVEMSEDPLRASTNFSERERSVCATCDCEITICNLSMAASRVQVQLLPCSEKSSVTIQGEKNRNEQTKTLMNTSNVRSNLKKFNLINQISVSFQSKLTSQSKSNSCCNVIWYKAILQLQGSVLRKYGAAMLGVTAQAITD